MVLQLARDAGFPAERLVLGGDRVGQTPITLELTKAALDREFEFRLRGHRAIVQKVPLQTDSRLVVMLPKAPKNGRPERTDGDSKPKPPTKTDKEGTVDPFGDL